MVDYSRLGGRLLQGVGLKELLVKGCRYKTGLNLFQLNKTTFKNGCNTDVPWCSHSPQHRRTFGVKMVVGK